MMFTLLMITNFALIWMNFPEGHLVGAVLLRILLHLCWKNLEFVLLSFPMLDAICYECCIERRIVHSPDVY